MLTFPRVLSVVSTVVALMDGFVLIARTCS